MLNRSTRLYAATLLPIAALGLAACGDDDSEAAGVSRPQVTFTASDDGITVPAEIPGGLVDIHVVAEPGEFGHHFLVARLNDGVSYDQVFAAPDDEFFSLVQVKGGNGTIAPGRDLDMTLDLTPGDDLAMDINDDPTGAAPAPFRVTPDDGVRAIEPSARGTITMGPGMVIDVPENFDAEGVWHFENVDPAVTHEAAMIRLGDGVSVSDFIEYVNNGEVGERPTYEDFGSIGALGPGEQGWVTLEPGEPGDYALICFIPGQTGQLHFMDGMFHEFTLEG